MGRGERRVICSVPNALQGGDRSGGEADNLQRGVAAGQMFLILPGDRGG